MLVEYSAYQSLLVATTDSSSNFTLRSVSYPKIDIQEKFKVKFFIFMDMLSVMFDTNFYTKEGG